MKHKSGYFLIGFLMCLSPMSFGRAQANPPKRSNSPAVPSDKMTPRSTEEEKVVRATYEKLTQFSKAALLIRGDSKKETVDETLFLRFELSNFRVGPIQEILEALHSEIITGMSGDTLKRWDGSSRP